MRVRTTNRGTATEGADFRASGEVNVLFAPGVTSKVVGVMLLDDAIDDDGDTVIMEITRAEQRGAFRGSMARIAIADGEAVNTIRNSDALPRAWIACFGRMAAEHVTDAIGERLRATRATGTWPLARKPLSRWRRRLFRSPERIRRLPPSCRTPRRPGAP